MIETITVHASGQGLHEFTRQVENVVREAGMQEGLCTLFIRHTSASLVIQENADPDVQRDLEAWLNRLVKEDDPLYTHTVEGPDDMPAHIKAMLTSPSLGVPVANGRAQLGTWQASPRQTPLVQSPLPLQCWPSMQGPQSPPQSVSLSLPFLVRSPQEGSVQTPGPDGPVVMQ